MASTIFMDAWRSSAAFALGHPRTNILGYTMPGFATSARTLDQARRLMAAVGCHVETIDIRPSCQQMLADIGHPAAAGEAVYDVTYENVQAGERTSHLFRLAKPELVPGQATEESLGPFALHDFALYYTLRFGFAPSLTAFLAWSAWHDLARGPWPDVPAASHRAYAIGQIKRWLGVFLQRFFQTSQFKRSAIPNAPKVGSGGALSPRADWRAPSDGHADAWLREVALIPEHE